MTLLWLVCLYLAHCTLADTECLVCNVDYSESQKVEGCECGFLEYCNKTAGSCKIVDGRRLCTGACYAINEDGHYTLTGCGHCNEHFPNLTDVEPYCLCSILETCNTTDGICVFDKDKNQTFCSGDCFVEQASITMITLFLFYFILLFLAVAFERWWNRRPESEVLIYD